MESTSDGNDLGNGPFMWDPKEDGDMDLRVWVMEQGWNGAYPSMNIVNSSCHTP